ncbi:PH domain-containing protein [Myroides sp. DF42-4-2]|uniref:PH domain-containing protein n=1 Tax=unclassified Myroides TaxID=2642485 RepID=UPI002577D1EE|nr:PH domain-containing protein [Myroides sp. DF42-4-2]MDM1408021.1 PH domain-containing protein [Myroides sp. DF42-4-2]
MESFSNRQIKNSQLPEITAVQFEPLHAKYKQVMLITTFAIVLILIAVGASGFYLPLNEEQALLVAYKEMILIGSIVLAVSLAVLRMAGVHKKGYVVREHDIMYKTGLINQKQIIIPFNRVQHVEIYEGFLLRLFGLCQIEFFTAGGNLGDLKIPGLLLHEADKIKAFVIEQVLPLSEETTQAPEVNLNSEGE